MIGRNSWWKVLEQSKAEEREKLAEAARELFLIKQNIFQRVQQLHNLIEALATNACDGGRCDDVEA